MKSTILNNRRLSPEMGTLQHERDFSYVNAYLNHWSKLETEQSKMNFLVMLKARRDQCNDEAARDVLKELAVKWVEEKYHE
jgi:hypothetical protein